MTPLPLQSLPFGVPWQAQKHNSPLVSLDFSEDSNYLQSASDDRQLFYRAWVCFKNHYVFGEP